MMAVLGIAAAIIFGLFIASTISSISCDYKEYYYNETCRDEINNNDSVM